MLPLLLFVCFLVLPVSEIYVIIQIGQVIGALPTVGLLLFESALGGWIIRREGRRAWNALQETLRTGAMPERELANAALILVGGTLLLTPGFVTDVFGFLFVLPFTRPLVRSLLGVVAKRRLEAQMTAYAASGGATPGHTPPGGPGGPASSFGGPRVVRGDVVDDDGR